MLPTSTLSDIGTLSVSGTNTHALIRKNGDSLYVNGRDRAHTVWSNVGIYPFAKVNHIEAKFKGGFVDAVGVPLPRTVEGAYDAGIWAGKNNTDQNIVDINQLTTQDCSGEAVLTGYVWKGGRVWIQYVRPTQTGAVYRVRIGNRDDLVIFDGYPQPTDLYERRPFVFWQQLEHRSRILHLTQTHSSIYLCDIRGYDPMAQIDGRLQHFFISKKTSNFAQVCQQARNAAIAALAQGKIVVVEMNFDKPIFNGYPVMPGWVHPALVAAHTYTALDVTGSGAWTFRNPWGKDKDSYPIGKANDGIGTMQEADFLGSSQFVWIG